MPKVKIEVEPDQWLGCQDCDTSFACYDGENRCIRLQSKLVSQPLYPVGTIVEHLRSGRQYKILASPFIVRIEANNIPAYIYRDYSSSDIIEWIRPQAEMEDGRFKLISLPE
jgi:hypothetical protein